MTLTIKPLHIAVLAAFLAGILVSAGIVFGLGSDQGSDAEEGDGQAVAVAPSPTPGVAPTEAAIASDAPTATPEAEAQVEPQPPAIRSCSEIKADPAYRSPEERTFFLDNCLGDSEPVVQADDPPPAQASSSSEATASEKLYRDRAAANLVVVASSFTVYMNTPSLGAYSDLLQLGTLFRKFAQEMDRLPPTPPRFEQVHNVLRSNLIDVADMIIEFSTLESESAFNAWLERYIDALVALDDAIADYSLVVGVDLPDVFAPE
jgi:hypothetical protein